MNLRRRRIREQAADVAARDNLHETARIDVSDLDKVGLECENVGVVERWNTAGDGEAAQVSDMPEGSHAGPVDDADLGDSPNACGYPSH